MTEARAVERRVDRRRALLLGVLLFGAAVRLYPVHRPYVGPDTQEAYPRSAVIATADGTWRPRWVVHGPGLFDALRATYTIWYGVGRITGRYRDRLDLVAAFAEDSLRFVIGGRLLIIACALLALWLVGRLGASLDSPETGVAAAALLAVAFVHVRESHQIWPDVPAGTLVLAAVMASLGALRRSTYRWAALAGVLGGLAIATKANAFPVLLPVGLGAFLGERRPIARVARVLAAALTTAGAYVLASPYAVLAFSTAREFMTHQYGLTFESHHGALPLGQLVVLGLGVPLASLAGVGVVTAARRWPRAEWIVVASFSIGYAIVLLLATRLFVRYLVLLAPFVALFAAHAVVTIVRAATPRHAGFCTVLAIAALAARPAVRAIEYDRFLARDDTRSLAGGWLAEHAAPNAAVILPNEIAYVNPILPPNALDLGTRYPGKADDLRRRLEGTFRPWAVSYQKPFIPVRASSIRDSYVVTTGHPGVFGHLNTTRLAVAALRDAGAEPVAQFVGTPEPLPPDVRYDPIDADYVPLRGWSALVRPGPNLTIWRLPQRAAGGG